LQQPDDVAYAGESLVEGVQQEIKFTAALLPIPKCLGPEQVRIEIGGIRILAEVDSPERTAPARLESGFELLDCIGFSDAGLSQEHGATVADHRLERNAIGLHDGRVAAARLFWIAALVKPDRFVSWADPSIPWQSERHVARSRT
jgi:hypothetical protein